MRDASFELAWRLRLAALSILFLSASTVSAAQNPADFQLPADQEVEQLLEAIDTYQRAVSTGDTFADPAFLIQSLKRLEARVAENPRTSEAFRLTLPLLYFRINQNSLAVRYLEGFVDRDPASRRGRLLLVFGYLREERYEQAKALAERALAEEPDNAYAHHLMGLSEVGLNDLEGAVSEFRKAVSLDPKFAESYFQLGSLLSKDRNTVEAARKNLEEALQLGLAIPEVHTRLGSVLIQLKRYPEAVAELKRATELAPQASEAYYLLAEAFRKTDRLTESAEALRKFSSLTEAETRKKERDAEGRTYFEEAMRLLRSDDAEQWRRAAELLQKAVEIFPGLAVAFYRLAQTDLLLKRKPAAEDAIRRAIQLNPLDAEYYFILARCLEGDEPEAAVEAIQKAISLDSAVADFHNLLGNLSFRRGDYGQSESSYRRATILEPNNPAFHLNLSSALDKTGKHEESVEQKELYFKLVAGQERR